MMTIKRICFPEANMAILVEDELDDQLGPRDVLLKSQFSIVSAGTEGAAYTGLRNEMPFYAPDPEHAYPSHPGYANLGEVVAMGSEVAGFAIGDRVLNFERHSSMVKVGTNGFALHVPEELPGEHAVFARMGGVGISALRASSVQAGDQVVVIGLGLVGNMAAQFMQIAGARVLAADLEDTRLTAATACGIETVVNSATTDLEEAVKEWTDGKGAHVVVEAVGASELLSLAVMLTRRHGEVIALGSPRARATFDVTPMLTRLCMEGIRMTGALEWLWPVDEVERGRHNIKRNYRHVLDWLQEGRLKVAPLLSELASPADCQRIYDGLTHEKDKYLGIVWDWKQL